MLFVEEELHVRRLEGHFYNKHSQFCCSTDFTFARKMRENAGSFQLHNTVLAIVVLSGVIAYTVLIYKLGQQSVQQTYDLPYSGIQHHGCYQRLFCA